MQGEWKDVSIHPGVVLGTPDPVTGKFPVAMISSKLPDNPPQVPIKTFYHGSGLDGNIRLDPPKLIENAKAWKNKKTGGAQSPMSPGDIQRLRDAMGAQFTSRSTLPLLINKCMQCLTKVGVPLLHLPPHRQVPRGNRKKVRAFPRGQMSMRMQVVQDILSPPEALDLHHLRGIPHILHSPIDLHHLNAGLLEERENSLCGGRGNLSGDGPFALSIESMYCSLRYPGPVYILDDAYTRNVPTANRGSLHQSRVHVVLYLPGACATSTTQCNVTRHFSLCTSCNEYRPSRSISTHIYMSSTCALNVNSTCLVATNLENSFCPISHIFSRNSLCPSSQ